MSQQVNKITAERSQRALLELVSQPGNDTCADCKTRNPRWASYSLGIFICVNCASIHRRIGTHVTKVKSLNLDAWTKEQVEKMKENGNIKSNALYNPDETRHPPPTIMTDSERDSELEIYIRDKYEHKRFISRSGLVATYLGPSRSLSDLRSKSPVAATIKPQTQPQPSLRLTTNIQPSNTARAKTPTGASQVGPPRSSSQLLTSQSRSQPPSQAPPAQNPKNPVWDDLISLQTPDTGATLPLQYQANPSPVISTLDMSNSNIMNTHLQSNPNAYATLPASPVPPFPLAQNAFQTGSLNMTPGSLQHLQPSLGFNATAPAMFISAGTPAATFSHGYLPSDSSVGFGGGITTGTSFQQHSPLFQQQSLPFQPQPSLFQPQAFNQPQIQQQYFSPQPQMQASTVPTGLSTQSYFPPQPQMGQQQQFVSQLPFGGSPSPFGQQQQVQQQQAFDQGAQYGSWPQGQQWGPL